MATPRVLFETLSTSDFTEFGISRDAQRFAIVFYEPRPEVDELNFVLNWFGELERLVPKN